MPLQNRVTPFGDIVAHEARGAFMGNRGGRIHDPVSRTLTNRRWASRRWICCLTAFKGRRRAVWGEGYTELFFLDEPTALAAGHRPCFECRRAAARAFFAALEPPAAEPLAAEPLSADAFDRIVHGQRLGPGGAKRIAEMPLAALPDGAMIAENGTAWAVRSGRLLAWTPAGYARARPLGDIRDAAVLTPPAIVAILARGFRPVWHPSADRLIRDAHLGDGQ